MILIENLEKLKRKKKYYFPYTAMFFLMSLRILKKTPDDFLEEDSVYTGFTKIKLEEEY